jgi:hypothetical protein
MKVAIMQPYFFPYIGYFQLINAVDVFVLYDEIEYTKKGWINRNRLLKNGSDELFSLPLKKDSDFLMINQRYLSDNWSKDKKKMLNTFNEAYRKAPFFKETFILIEDSLNYSNMNLFDFLYETIKRICEHLNIETKIIVSSTLDFDNNLKSADKVLNICKILKANEYINPIGGVELYNKVFFKNKDIALHFLKAKNVVYKQFENNFIPFLSIIDVLMFNSTEEVKKMIASEYEIL